nr:hypothetical protein [Burkholderia sp. ABCPW 14]
MVDRDKAARVADERALLVMSRGADRTPDVLAVVPRIEASNAAIRPREHARRGRRNWSNWPSFWHHLAASASRDATHNGSD